MGSNGTANGNGTATAKKEQKQEEKPQGRPRRDTDIDEDNDKPNTRESSPPPTARRFMQATWWEDPEKVKLRFPNILPWFMELLRYKGEFKDTKGTKMAYLTPWTQIAYVTPRALAPLGVQWVSYKLGFFWPLPVAFAVYATSFVLFAIDMLLWMNRLNAAHGHLDSGSQRDTIPDIRLTKTALGLLLTVTVRPLLACFLVYDKYEWPHVEWTLPLSIFMYNVVLDFWFYWYHRAMHESPTLWQYHKTHHMTKHPAPLLSAFGDEPQDFFDILVIPLLSWMTWHLDFHTWYIASIFTIFIEAAGHAGTYIYWTPPITGPILRPLGLELILEDHDLHHRHGWRSSSNYGKQTRIWDTVFGTRRERLEMIPANIDYARRV